MEILLFLGISFVSLLFVIILGLLYLFTFTKRKPDTTRHESEKYFYNENGVRSPFPSLNDDASVYLSIIVPSYNEESRLPTMLDEAVEFCEKRCKSDKTFSYEFIIVDDGSKDKTTKVAMEYTKKYGSDKIRVLTFEKNRGKGGAVRLGMYSARGRFLLFADADGASKFSDITKLEDAMTQLRTQKSTDMAVVCGSRAHLEEESIANRSLFRTILMHGFHFLVGALCVKNIRDTQCGFKLFTRQAARILFRNLHVSRWAFDVDLLYLANHFSIPCAEVAIVWQEIDGSKMIPLFSWAQMGLDLLMIRLKYVIGAWTIDPVEWTQIEQSDG